MCERFTRLAFIPCCCGRSPCSIKFQTRITPRPWQDWSEYVYRFCLCRESRAGNHGLDRSRTKRTSRENHRQLPQASGNARRDEAGFDLSFSDELLFDHATMLPIHFLTPRMDIPVVPLILNTLTPPMPSPKRCYALGRVLGETLEKHSKRIAIVATGGLSHWPGEAKHGKINIPFDKRFLDILTTGDRSQLAGYTHEEINVEAGSGGHEIRTWITLAGALPDWKATLLAYEPVAPWATGCGLVTFSRF